MTQEPALDPRTRRRNRITLVALLLVFLLPVAVAVVLHLAQWRPAHYSNHGVMLQPAQKLADVALFHADGTPYAYAPRERRWQVVVVPTPDCAAHCVELVEALDKVWRLQGRRAERLQVLWFGEIPAQATSFRNLLPMRPDPAFLARLPELAESGAPSIYLVDPFGFLVMHYPPGVDPADLRADIAKLLK